jgi:hypothetical protein
MDATNLPQTTLLLKQLAEDYPQYSFREANDIFRWSSQESTIYFVLAELHSNSGVPQLFHELGHAELTHQGYHLDIELLGMEAAAWERGQEIAGSYSIIINDEDIQAHLNSYRIWLQDRSTCPECRQTGVQNTKSTYQCLNCRCSWRVNDAKWCSLRRYRLTT